MKFSVILNWAKVASSSSSSRLTSINSSFCVTRCNLSKTKESALILNLVRKVKPHSSRLFWVATSECRYKLLHQHLFRRCCRMHTREKWLRNWTSSRHQLKTYQSYYRRKASYLAKDFYPRRTKSTGAWPPWCNWPQFASMTTMTWKILMWWASTWTQVKWLKSLKNYHFQSRLRLCTRVKCACKVSTRLESMRHSHKRQLNWSGKLSLPRFL